MPQRQQSPRQMETDKAGGAGNQDFAHNLSRQEKEIDALV